MVAMSGFLFLSMTPNGELNLNNIIVLRIYAKLNISFIDPHFLFLYINMEKELQNPKIDM